MSDVLHLLIEASDHAVHHCYSYHETHHEWPSGELDRLLAAGLLHPVEPADRVNCGECWRLEEVLFMHDQGKTAVYVQCPRCGANEVSSEWLQQWQATCDDLIRILNERISPSGSCTELVEQRIWRLGNVRLAEANRSVYFGRALDAADAWQVLNQAGIAARSVLFVPALTPSPDTRIDDKPIVIPLTSVFSWDGNNLYFDREFVEAEVNDLAPTNAVVPTQKRAPRLTVIERLCDELSEHLLAARDHAFAEQDRTSEAKLLPRPTKEFLARRLGVHPSSVSRAFKDEKARELNYLWELANDVHRIMEFSGNRAKLQ